MRRILDIFLTLRGRLILLVCFATVPAILFIFYAATQERESTMSRLAAEARQLGAMASREHAYQLGGARALLHQLGRSLLSRQPKPFAADCSYYLRELLTGFPQFANLGVISPDGVVVCSAASLRHPVNLAGDIAFQRAMKSRDVEAGTYVIGPIVGRPILRLAYAVREGRHKPRAVLFIAIELSWLDKLAHQANLPADYTLYITDRTGQILARSGWRAGDSQESQWPMGALRSAIGEPLGAVIRVADTLRYFVAVPLEGNPGVYVVTSMPYDRVQRAANESFYRTMLVLFLVTIFVITAAILAAEFSILRVLRALTRTANRLGSGDLSARPRLSGAVGELGELARAFGTMADNLAAREQEARALSQRLQLIRDEQAGRIARELHDELGQILTGLRIDLAGVRRFCACQPHSQDADKLTTEMAEHIDSAIDSVRRISSALRPPVLDRLGLLAALEWLVGEFETKAGCAVFLNVRGLAEPIDNLISTTVFRIVQEALTNVARHAQATQVTIDLEGHDDTLDLAICDNGKGIAPGDADGAHALGILGMRERVHLVRGSWNISGTPGQGTTITVTVPRSPPRYPDFEALGNQPA